MSKRESKRKDRNRRRNPISSSVSGVIHVKSPTPKTLRLRAEQIGRLSSSDEYDISVNQDEGSSTQSSSCSSSSSSITADRDFVRGLILLLSRPDRVWLVRQICSICGAQIDIKNDRTVRTDGQHLCASCWHDICGQGDTQVDIDIKQLEQDIEQRKRRKRQDE